MKYNCQFEIQEKVSKTGSKYSVIVIHVGNYSFEKFLTNEQVYILTMLTENAHKQ